LCRTVHGQEGRGHAGQDQKKQWAHGSHAPILCQPA
jgi:hypothetical protein